MKGTCITNFRAIFQYLNGHSEENHEKLIYDSYYMGQDSNSGLPAYEGQVLAILFHSICIRMAGK